MSAFNGLTGLLRRERGALPRRGLEEFFDPNPTSPIAGRQWAARDLRLKSNEDLHKLWYVLLKERNMLKTMKLEAKRIKSVLPAADRWRKVRKGMGGIKQVIGERDRAVIAYRQHLEDAEPKEGVSRWDAAYQVVVKNVHGDVEEEEFVQLMEEMGLEPVKYEILIERHKRFGQAIIEMPNRGDARVVRDKLHNKPFIDGSKLKVWLDKEVLQFGRLSQRPEPSDMIVRARMLKYKQFPAEMDPLRPKNKYKRRSDVESAFERLQMAEDSGAEDAQSEAVLHKGAESEDSESSGVLPR